MVNSFVRSDFANLGSVASFEARSERFDCRLPATFRFRNFETMGEIVNIAAAGMGARINAYVDIRPGMNASVSCSRLGALNCVIRWCSYPKFGMQLGASNQDLTKYAEFLDSLQQKAAE
jgi:hypothetical protein